MNKKEFKIEMVRNNDTGASIAEFLGISPVSVSNKLNGKSEFTQGEISRIKEKYSLTPERVDEIFFASDVSCEDTDE